jgi:aspartyl-tRNA(Asn)/glutamyl-tRNA(Gln) amidotransferase subunit B
MEKGNLRCEANVSVRKIGDQKFGTKVELKNLNSVRFMQRAIEFEVERQIGVLESGGTLQQETRLWDERAAETRVMRSKEEAHDYRYFPEPDLPPLIVTNELIENVRASMPELPETRRRRFMENYGLSFSDASQLTSDRSLADYYEKAAEISQDSRVTANWIRSELLRELETAGTPASSSPISPEDLGGLVKLVASDKISGKQGKDVLVEMFNSIIDQVIAANPQQAEQYRAGKETLFGFFVGQVIKASKGKANPKVVNERLKSKMTAL